MSKCETSFDSLEIVEDVPEGAARILACLLLQLEEALVSGHVGLPLRMEDEVVVVSLMAEEKMLITPVRGSELCVKDQLGDKLLRAAKLSWLILSIDVVKDRTDRNRGQIIHEVVSGTLSKSVREHDLTCGLEA